MCFPKLRSSIQMPLASLLSATAQSPVRVMPAAYELGQNLHQLLSTHSNVWSNDGTSAKESNKLYSILNDPVKQRHMSFPSFPKSRHREVCPIYTGQADKGAGAIKAQAQEKLQQVCANLQSSLRFLYTCRKLCLLCVLKLLRWRLQGLWHGLDSSGPESSGRPQHLGSSLWRLMQSFQ